ncbi:MAG: glycosyl hydrolase [Prevotellaceae bacterium]|nr:glycosyl hydrolase [Prevotellaceae bacterium]
MKQGIKQLDVATHLSVSKRWMMGCLLAGAFHATLYAQERKVEVMPSLSVSVKLDAPVDIHLTDAVSPISKGVQVNLASEDSWVFFDNMKPNDVLDKLNDNILIDGKPLNPDTNARLAIYRQGAIVIPHSPDYCPLTTFTEPQFKGKSEQYRCNKFYTNAAPADAPDRMVLPLQNDNSIRSLRLKRGYVATLANGADGMGYSRVFVADTGDIELPELPLLLDGKVSYIRVMRWQYVSKKGWAGSIWNSMPEGLKYVGEQCDFTNSTWYYNWGTSAEATTNPNAKRKSYNQEFVPEKWGSGGNFSKLYTIEEASHLIGYNEPDHTEQSNVSVEKAIEEWPVLQRTGFRLGSPATTDFNWLYSFMSEAKKRNYRVDYVVIHAYWGGLSGPEWYEQLRDVHKRTGRPLWIKEWNNGANWTHEGWPSGTEAQQQKQLRDLKEILTVMDTASFVERYSIYNWVEDKRAIILPNATLSPAGEYYKENSPEYFFSHENEVIPVWTVRTAPSLSYGGITGDGEVLLEWKDENIELIDHYIVEYSLASDFSAPAIAAMVNTADFIASASVKYAVPVLDSAGEGCFYRVKAVPLVGSEKTSNVVKVNKVANKADKIFFDETYVTENWAPLIFGEPYTASPVPVLGIPTYRNKMPLSTRVRRVMPQIFDFRLTTWDYQLSPSFVNPDTIATVIFPEMKDEAGILDWNGVKAQVAVVENVGRQWKKVLFGTKFDVVPVVIPCQITNNCPSAASVRVRNVTEEGFEVCLRYEGREKNIEGGEEVPAENVSYLAVTPGQGTVEGRKVLVGQTPDAVVGDNLLGGYEIDYSAAGFTSVPLLFGAMQTEEDTITSTLRVKSRNKTSAVIFKDREKSVAHERVKPERVGWMTIERTTSGETDGMTALEFGAHRLSYNSHSQSIAFGDCGQKMLYVAVFDLQGRIVASAHNVTSLSLASLPKGAYVVRADECDSLKIIK